MLLARIFRAFLQEGSVSLIDAKGRRYDVRAPAPGPHAAVRFHDHALHRAFLLNPPLAAGEGYMDGRLTVEEGTLYDFLDVCTRSLDHLYALPYYRTLRVVGKLSRGLAQLNPLGRARRNVAHHYDLSGALYDLFLDADRQYSCAYFTAPGMSLEAAQEAKKRHIAAKLCLDRRGLRVLDIGCGWGGLALYLAAEAGAQVTGVTLSEEQFKLARERAARAGLADRIRIELLDYRAVEGRFDRIVSVGMFEHVGVPHYPEFFGKVHDLLTDDGVALLHSIGRSDGPGSTNPWIRKYIFPGGYAPALSEVLPIAEASSLYVTDIEILRLHYAKTLRAWHDRFQAQRDKVVALYDERFARMWEFYLVGCELAFRNDRQMVFQMQMSRSLDRVPLTRDYIGDWERSHADAARRGAESAA